MGIRSGARLGSPLYPADRDVMLKGRYLLIGGLCAVMVHAWAFSALQGVLNQSEDAEVAQDEGKGGISVILAAADFPGQPAEPGAREPEPAAAPEPVPEPDPAPDPIPDTSPEPTPAPEPEPRPQSEPKPSPEPRSEPEPEQQPEPVTDTSPASSQVEEPSEPYETDASQSTPARQSDSGGTVAEEKHYMQVLLNHLNRYKRYPDSARRMRREGVVTVTFTVSEKGQVSDVRVAPGSGFAPLDDEVKAMLKRAMPLPAIPSDIGKDSFTMTLPVAFSLQR